jgi:hypothetical protein
MTSIDRQKVAEFFAEGDAATTSFARGKALENLIVYLFGLIPGIILTAQNKMNAFHAQEIDVAFWNDGHEDGLRWFDFILLVECKNWRDRVGYSELAVFKDKLSSRGRSMGILVAANGITGDPIERSRAYSVLERALSDHQEILVVTRDEIESLTDTTELVYLLKQKRAQLAVSGTIFLSTGE